MTQTELTEEQLARIRDFVAALRSGDYAQTHSRLGSVNDQSVKRYCCEGVAAERYGEQLGYEVKWIPSGRLLLGGDADYAENDFWLKMGLVGEIDHPSTSLFIFNLPSGQTLLNAERQSSITYMALNDDGFTFSQIADMLTWQFLCPSAD
jgi:hypothetical protein